MNSLKQSASKLTHDSARRLSLPLECLDACFPDSSFLDLAKKIRFSPVCPSEKSTGKFPVPKIFLDDHSITESGLPSSAYHQNEIYPRTSSPSFSRLQSRRKSLNLSPNNDFRFSITTTRRASCGPEFLIESQSPDLSVFESWRQSKRIARSPDGEANPKKIKREKFDESVSSRGQSYLPLPSLSPCYEDKPKFNSSADRKAQHYFSFKQQSSNDAGIFKDFRKQNAGGRRASFHATLASSPRFPHSGVFCCPDAYVDRRKSIGSVPMSKLLWGEKKKVNRTKVLIPFSTRFEAKTDLLIGKGGFGTVKVGLWKGQKVAVKILSGKKVAASIECEMKALQLDPHQGVVQTYALITPLDSEVAELSHRCSGKDLMLMSKLSRTFNVSDEPITTESCWAWVISELCTPLNLLKIINSSITISDCDFIRILLQIAMALRHIHSCGLVHLDVKPSNCFITQSGTVKLGDFGCLTKINEVPNEIIGTVVYQAPEVLKGGRATDRCDVYSFAITAWQLLTSDTPYQGFHPHVIIYKVTCVNHRPTTNQPFVRYTLMQKVLLSVIERCWAQDPEERPTANSLCRILASLLCSAEQVDLRRIS